MDFDEDCILIVTLWTPIVRYIQGLILSTWLIDNKSNLE